MGLLKKWLGRNKDFAEIGKLGVDIHSHLIPKIDDGAQTMEHAIGMINKFASMGYKKLITTPHVMQEGYTNTSETILQGLEALREEIKAYKIPIEIDAAAEYYFDEGLFEKIKSKELLTFAENHVLFEFSFMSEPQGVDELIFELQTNGYQPVLAHFERYGYYNSIQKAVELREKGVKIQMNLNALAGHYGPMAQKQAEAMVKNKIVDIAGSDCHRIEHLQILERNLNKKYYHQLLDLPLMNYTL